MRPTGRGRREPERTCIGCRATGSKRDLIRMVRHPDGSVGIDPTGRAAGRGAYVHTDTACVRQAARRGAIGRALRVRLGPEEAARLVEEIGSSVGEQR